MNIALKNTMRMIYAVLGVLMLLLQYSNAFSLQPTRRFQSSSLSLAADNDNGPSRSRIEGNQVEPSSEEIAIMDEMITKLASAKPYELPNAVQRAFRVISSPRFFLRIAERTDDCKDETERKRLAALASNLVSTLDAVVSTAEDKLGECSKDVETVVKAAAEPDTGEFLVPLLPERVDSMREALNNLDAAGLEGDGFLSTVDAWMNKSHQDGLDLMVGILQKVLQIYAGRQVIEARARQNEETDGPAGKLFDALLQTDADAWEESIRQGVEEGVSAEEVVVEIQRNMETIVLSLDSGSMAQRVQAEYLQEMVKRVEAVKKSS